MQHLDLATQKSTDKIDFEPGAGFGLCRIALLSPQPFGRDGCLTGIGVDCSSMREIDDLIRQLKSDLDSIREKAQVYFAD